ncbi:MAG: hypothetical protein E5X48_10450 [Mesorhizobium sp.]|uniref:hypothetical protein n=1 Tax=Mesorhizobium sp. TaxID=1871066 RepID=UPI00121CF97C|nr:hypothetical protein [Mesorhizobium sp.]TIQ36209.1 MAG: hypothetical protein E5X48_10450 [Mesorhizobium sp.]
MSKEQNRRETGARKYPANPDPDPSDRFSQTAANNEKPHDRFGLSRKRDEVEDKTRQAEGQNPPGRAAPTPETEKRARTPAGGHSREPKASKAVRRRDAFEKKS